MNKRFKPLIDKQFFIIWVPTSIILIAMTAISAMAPISLLITIPVDIFTYYFLFSSLAGYVELREESVYIKFGFIIKREIPYSKIRGVVKSRGFYSESMLSLKNSFEHVNIKYNTFDLACVSVIGNDEFISEIEKRMNKHN